MKEKQRYEGWQGRDGQLNKHENIGDGGMKRLMDYVNYNVEQRLTMF